ncbi:MAG: hypothetical protein AMXMBFR13_35450 [Phycisphaerae bacterium]
MLELSRRELLKDSALLGMGAGLVLGSRVARAQLKGDRPARAADVTVLNPRNRVPLSLLIDDSTCLVNLNRFAVPQFATAWGNGPKYRQPWRDWPVEIPDDFIRKFADFADEHGVKGKFSIVPYPACIGRLDRVLPGWTDQALDDSLKLVRTRMAPNWDIHPEMVTHTRVIDTKTGHPYPDRTRNNMENWDWSVGRSVDELADYMSYALRILKNVGLPCEGITTPGVFGSGARPELAQATLQACRDVFNAQVPHYFLDAIEKGSESVVPRVEYASGLEGADPRCVVSIVACTRDWTGGWDCSSQGELDRFITPDLKAGRLVEVIDRGEPAILLAHWTGIYFNGQEVGFKILREVVRRLAERYEHLSWMKLSQIARYWAARELTRIDRHGGVITLQAPFAAADFTIRVTGPVHRVPQLQADEKQTDLREVTRMADLKTGSWLREPNGLVLCFSLPRGRSRLRL